MDGFMDRVTQNLGTEDIIRANSEAEAREFENVKNKRNEYENKVSDYESKVADYQSKVADYENKVTGYEDILSEIRRLNLKSVETNEMTNQLVSSSVERLEEYRTGGAGKDISEDIGSIKESLKDQEEYIHKENVRVYRNVQASIVEELRLQTEALGVQNKALEKKLKGIKGLAVTVLILSIIGISGVAAVLLQMMGIINLSF